MQFSRFDRYPIPTTDSAVRARAKPHALGFRARPRQAAGTGHETIPYQGFGLVVKLFEDYVALGIHGLIPIGDFTRIVAFFNDEREQYFSNSLHPELYGDR